MKGVLTYMENQFSILQATFAAPLTVFAAALLHVAVFQYVLIYMATFTLTPVAFTSFFIMLSINALPQIAAMLPPEFLVLFYILGTLLDDEKIFAGSSS